MSLVLNILTYDVICILKFLRYETCNRMQENQTTTVRRGIELKNSSHMRILEIAKGSYYFFKYSFKVI